MIFGIGCDILLLSSIKESSVEPETAFLRRTFTKREIAEGSRRSRSDLYYKTRFCAKEAVFKTLHMDGNRARLSEIEIVCDETGQPKVTLYGGLKQHAQRMRIDEILVSLSYDGEYAIANAIAQCRY